jgi:hypothetical protein
LRAGRGVGPRVAALEDRHWCHRRSSGIPRGRRSGPNDRRGPDADGWPPDGENPAGCHCCAWPPAARAAARTAGILRAFRTSLTSTSAGRGRPVRSGRSARVRPPVHAAPACAISLAVLRRQQSHRDTVAGVATAHVPLCWLVARIRGSNPGAEPLFR